MKRNKTLIHTTTWVSLRIILPHKGSQSQRPMSHDATDVKCAEMADLSAETESRLVADGAASPNGLGFLSGVEGVVLTLIRVMVAQVCEFRETTEQDAFSG